MQDSSGNLYGTARSVPGGVGGSAFKLDPSDQFTLLYDFTYGGVGGYDPLSGLVMDAAGNLYGTTFDGPAPGSPSVFKITANDTFSVLHSFAVTASPVGPLVLDEAGNLYGATTLGGHVKCNSSGQGCGEIFKLDPSGNLAVLFYFGSGKTGIHPNGGLIRDASGNLFGTTMDGGNAGSHGLVFELDPTGKESVLYIFKGFPDGSQPQPSLIRDAAGNFYGSTVFGGQYSCGSKHCGTVFKLDAGGNETVLHSFTGGADGENPNGGLVMDAACNLYGTASSGGAPGCYNSACGTVFKIDASGNYSLLYTFPRLAPTGSDPEAGLVIDSAGNLYGTAIRGGDINDCNGDGCGVIFKITP